MKKIIYILPNLSISSGVSNIVMNYYRKINKQEMQIDFFIVKKSEQSYENEIIKLGGKIFYLENELSLLKIRKSKKEIYNFFKNNYYDIVELHAPTFSFVFLKIAKACNVPIRIVHSHSTVHSTSKIKNAISTLLNINLKRYANKFFACSEKSGQYWYGNKICNSDSYRVITNGIDIEKYSFDAKAREDLRKEYNIEDNIVIGFVGRLSKDKNLLFFIKVMKEIIEKDKKYKFLIIGDGTEKERIRKKCKKIEENVIFLGRRDDVNKQLNCLDLLVLPSKREGLPMVAVEAQTVGVQCFLSDSITKEVDIGGCEFLQLKKKIWVNKILNFTKRKSKVNKEVFNIDNCALELEEIYKII